MGIYAEYLEKYPELSNSEIADLILEHEDLNIKRKSILRALQRLQEPAPQISGAGRKGDFWSIEEKEYVFEFGDHFFDIPKEQIAAACVWYVEPNGLSLQAVCDKLWSFYKRDIDESYLSRIFKCLKITKSSNGLAPHIVAEWSEEEISEFFLKMRREKIEKRISESDQYKTLYEQECKKTFQMDSFVSGVGKALHGDDMPKFEFPKRMPLSMDSDMVLVLSDWHVGMKSASFNKEVYKRRIDQLCLAIVNHFMTTTRPIRDLHVLVLGDMLDGPLANMRPEQALSQDLYHEQQVIWTARGLSRVIQMAASDVTGSVFVHGIGGNHGRCGPGRGDDPTRFADKMAYVLAEEMMKSDKKPIKWELYNEVLATAMVRKTQLLFMHGDRGAKNPKNLVWANRNERAKSFVVCYGHYHSVKAEEVEKNIMVYRNGCLCGADDYALSHGYSARPAQIMFEVRDDGPMLPILLPVE